MNLDLTLYLATDADLLGTRSLAAVVDAAITGGVTVVQLRHKTASGSELYQMGQELLTVTRTRGVPLIINDRVDIMLALDADGVHVGPMDVPLEAVRRLAGTRLVGTSVNSLRDLERAQRCGVDYIGIGPAFHTNTKADARDELGPEGVARLAQSASVPAVAIGGIDGTNVQRLRGCGLAGVCVISAILGAPDAGAAARGLRSAWQG